jgi:hypothetical protein
MRPRHYPKGTIIMSSAKPQILYVATTDFTTGGGCAPFDVVDFRGSDPFILNLEPRHLLHLPRLAVSFGGLVYVGTVGGWV